MKKYKIGCAIVNEEGYLFVEIVRNDAILNFLADDMNCITRGKFIFLYFRNFEKWYCECSISLEVDLQFCTTFYS